MSDEQAQLASVATALDELTDRVTRLAETLTSTDEQTSSELFEIERTLQQAARRLERLVRET